MDWVPSNGDMKRIATVGVVVGALGCLGFLAAGQGIMHTGSPQALSTHWPGTTQTNILVVPFAGSNWLSRTLPPADKPEFKSQTLPPPAGPISPSAPATVPLAFTGLSPIAASWWYRVPTRMTGVSSGRQT